MFPSDFSTPPVSPSVSPPVSPPVSVAALVTLLRGRWDLPEDVCLRLLHGEGGATPEEVLASPQSLRPLGASGALWRIFSAVCARRPEVEAQITWLRTPHSAFEGHAPLDLMIASLEELQWVAYTLDTAEVLGQR